MRISLAEDDKPAQKFRDLLKSMQPPCDPFSSVDWRETKPDEWDVHKDGQKSMEYYFDRLHKDACNKKK